MKFTILLILAISFAGCAQDVLTRYPSGGTAADATGTLVVKLTSPLRDVCVTVDGKLVAKDEFTEFVKIESVPVGRHRVEVAASGEMREEALAHSSFVMIEADQEEAVLISTPPLSTGYYIMQAAWGAALVTYLAIVTHERDHR